MDRTVGRRGFLKGLAALPFALKAAASGLLLPEEEVLAEELVPFRAEGLGGRTVFDLGAHPGPRDLSLLVPAEAQLQLPPTAVVRLHEAGVVSTEGGAGLLGLSGEYHDALAESQVRVLGDWLANLDPRDTPFLWHIKQGRPNNARKVVWGYSSLT